MARTTNLNKKIEDIKAKIEKKNEQLKDLKKELTALEEAKKKERFQDIEALINSKNLNPEDVLNVLNQNFQ